jgi:hypothetical protein
VKLKIDLLRDDGGTQPRAKIDESVVAEYAEAMRGGAQFPPVVAFYDGSEYWLADGFHRGTAAALAGLEEIEVDVRQGNKRDAILFSVGVNSAHGLRRTNEDKRRAVLRLLEDEEWGQWSDREIARRCNVGPPLVAELRPHLKDLTDSTTPRKVERNGTTYTQDTSRIGKATRPVVDEMPLEEVEQRPKPEPKPEKIEPTPADRAIGDIRNYIDVVLEEVDTDMGRHYVVNSIIKYLREKSIAFNQSA